MAAPDLSAMRIAGWHGDLAALRTALLEKFDSRLARAYYEGKREKRNGRLCGCVDCTALEVAPPIALGTTTTETPMMTAHETKKIPASQYGGTDYGTAERALRVCLGDWLTATGAQDVPREPAAELAREMFSNPMGRHWLSLEQDEDGLPIDGELRCDEADAARVIAEIQAFDRPEEEVRLAEIQVQRTYQLGGSSVFAVTDGATLARVIAKDKRKQIDNRDEQGVSYAVTTIAEARALGCLESVTGAWILSGTEYEIKIEAATFQPDAES